MIRKDTYKIAMTRRQMLSVGDKPDHYLMLTEMEGKPLGEKVGVAGEFVSRRAVGYQDSLQGSGRLEGYVVETFREGTIFSRYEGSRDAASKTTKGTWEYYEGTGRFAAIRGQGTFTVKNTDKPNEYLLEVDGEHTLWKEWSAEA